MDYDWQSHRTEYTRGACFTPSPFRNPTYSSYLHRPSYQSEINDNPLSKPINFKNKVLLSYKSTEDEIREQQRYKQNQKSRLSQLFYWILFSLQLPTFYAFVVHHCFTRPFRWAQMFICQLVKKFLGWDISAHVQAQIDIDEYYRRNKIEFIEVPKYPSDDKDKDKDKAPSPKKSTSLSKYFKRYSYTDCLFSSDEEDFVDWLKVAKGDESEVLKANRQLLRPHPVKVKDGEQEYVDIDFDDNELPFVWIVDNLVYFVNLCGLNFPAFKKEAFQTLYKNILLSWSEREYLDTVQGGKEYFGHNINPSRWRLKSYLLTKGVDYLRQREVNARMNRLRKDAHKTWVLRVALMSRVGIFVIQMFSRKFLGVFKHDNDGFKFMHEENYGKWLDPIVNSTMGGYVNWDAHYFLHISVYGYTSENIMAFFPLLPVILAIPSKLIYLFCFPFISLSSIVIVFGVVFNMWLFVKCAENMYELAKLWSGENTEIITATCLLFCFNPASIFFSGLYTETLFAYLTSKVIILLLEREYTTSITCAALSSVCRSNGLLNIGFIIALLFQREIMKFGIPSRFLHFVLRSLIIVFASCVPFIMFQKYTINTFCKPGVLYDSVPPYCVQWTLPYSYIQKKYWNVGFLEYFQFKQIPNFILAAPALYFLGTHSWNAMRVAILHIKRERSFGLIYFSSQALHGLFLTGFCFFFVHVQVSTRMIMSACPYLYLFLADSNVLELERFRNREIMIPRQSITITFWCLLYYVVGTIGFSLGLPWT